MGRLEKVLPPSCVLEWGLCLAGPRQDAHADSEGFVEEAARAWPAGQGWQKVVRPTRRRRTRPLRPARIRIGSESSKGDQVYNEKCAVCVDVCDSRNQHAPHALLPSPSDGRVSDSHPVQLQ
jgi:predicted dienelactone hydrolase